MSGLKTADVADVVLHGVASITPADLEALYRRRFRAFLSTVTALLGDVESARDVVQDGFASALRRRGDFAGSGSLEGWVWRIVVNRALDERRFRQRRLSLALEWEPEPRSNGSSEGAEAVRAQLMALPERQRLAVFLRYYADLDYDSIARILGVSPGTVGAALHQARSVLRERLKGEIVD